MHMLINWTKKMCRLSFVYEWIVIVIVLFLFLFCSMINIRYSTFFTHSKKKKINSKLIRITLHKQWDRLTSLIAAFLCVIEHYERNNSLKSNKRFHTNFTYFSLVSTAKITSAGERKKNLQISFIEIRTIK